LRFQSAARIIEELNSILEKFDFIEVLGIGDDDFFMRSKEQLLDFATKYKERIGLPFGVALSANTYDKEKIEILLDSGLKAVQMGVQSGSQRILDKVYHRKIKIAKSKEVVQQIVPYQKSHGMDLLIDFIIDNPYETRNDIIQTYHYLLEVPYKVRVNIFFLAFFPGTPLYESALKDAFIQPFSEKAFRFYTRSSLRFQKNYETFLVLFLRYLRRRAKLQPFFPKVFLSALGSRAVRCIASAFPKSFYSFLSRTVQ
jgi:radical SAM superfamily enzyme YgiQ (UPF0313 family)